MPKKIFIYPFFFLFYLNIGYAKIQNKIVLKVENEIITQHEVKNKILTDLLLSGQKVTQENINNQKKIALERLIQNKLMKIELSKYDYKAERKDLEAFLNSISGNNIEKLKNDFKNNQLDFELFLEEKETQFKWQKLIYSMYSNKIEIDKAAIEKEINNIFENKVEVEEYNISEIELLFNNQSEQEIQSEILTKINNEGFEKTASKYSIANSSSNNGNLGWLNVKSLSKNIYDVLKKLDIGEISDPIKNQDSILFLKLNDKRISKSDNIDKNKLRQNLVNQRKNKLFNLYSRSYLSKLKNTSFIQYK